MNSDQTKGLSKQRCEGADWMLLAASKRTLDEKNKLRDGLLSKRSQDLMVLRILNLYRWQMMPKVTNCFQAKIKSRAVFEKHGLKMR